MDSCPVSPERSLLAWARTEEPSEGGPAGAGLQACMSLLGHGFASCGRSNKIPWTRGFKATEMHYLLTLEDLFVLRL